MDTLLDLMKQAQVNIPLKAVVTPTSKSWVFGDLLAHLSGRAHRLYRRKGDRQSMMTKRICFRSCWPAGAQPEPAGGPAARPPSSAASSAAPMTQRYSTVFYDVFDTVTQVIAYCDSEEEFTAQMDALHADLAGVQPALRHLQRLRRRGERQDHQRQRGHRPGDRWMTRSSGCWSWPGRCTTPPAAS